MHSAQSPQRRESAPTWDELPGRCAAKWNESVRISLDRHNRACSIECAPEILGDVCGWLFDDLGLAFATLVVEEDERWSLSYLFYDDMGGWVSVRSTYDPSSRTVPSISDRVHAADWHERESEDLFGLEFRGHPRLGEFVLHEDWPEGVNPMRKDFAAKQQVQLREIEPTWVPPTIVESPGAFAMPIGPVFSDFAESAHFLLETVGEDVIVTIPRFFYKYRGVEKIAEGQAVDRVLLLAERFSGSSAFAHGLAFCQAVETICGADVPPRARALRALFAETERLRHHAAAIAGICGSTALAVATSQAALIVEELLRLTGAVGGHRYLFGLIRPGGMMRDLSAEGRQVLIDKVRDILRKLGGLERMLRYSSSFLDRLEDVGVVPQDSVRSYGLVGPIARASGIGRDLRRIFAYAGYPDIEFTVPIETEGDGYARLRVLFREAQQSAAIIERIAASLPAGPVAADFPLRAGAAIGAVEAPLGAAFHWVRIGTDGLVVRYRITSPSFTNWHGFHLAAENFAFQDFPIIMATFGLSNAECDR